MNGTAQFSGKRILLVEDDEMNQLLMKDIFESQHALVDLAQDGFEAIEKFRTNKYDLILMDIQMPRKDGYQATIEIRKLEATGDHTPILALTASVLPADRKKCLETGMDDFIGKPIDLNDLRKKVSTWLENKR